MQEKEVTFVSRTGVDGTARKYPLPLNRPQRFGDGYLQLDGVANDGSVHITLFKSQLSDCSDIETERYNASEAFIIELGQTVGIISENEIGEITTIK